MNKRIPIQLSIILLSIIPLVLMSYFLTLVINNQSKQLVNQGLESFNKFYLESKHQELVNYVKIATISVDHLVEDPQLDENQRQQKTKRLINDLIYGPEGYFFLYEYDGTNLVLPPQPELVGQNLWDLEDSEGKLLIQELIRAAQNGGGTFQYIWPKPSSGEEQQKLSYATELSPWPWMVGTGVYLDDTQQVSDAFTNELSETTRETTTLILGVTLTCLVLVSCIGFAINLSEKKSADIKLRQLTHSMINFQEEERSRVARELHDGIVQMLVSSRFQLQAADMHLQQASDGAGTHITKGADILNEAILEIKRISKGLRPASLDDLGLGAAMNILTNEFTKRTGIEVELHQARQFQRFDSKIETCFYRIAQEALTNIEKHANADQVVIRFSLSERALMMLIKDNGTGFDREQVAGANPLDGSGTGLRNMQERIELLGGLFSVFSSVGKGTIIKVKLPIDHYIFKNQVYGNQPE